MFDSGPGPGITVETAAREHPQARSLAYPVGYGVYYFLNNRSLGRAMTNLDENVVPVFRRALVNGKSQDGARSAQEQTSPRSRSISSEHTSRQRTANKSSNTHKALVPSEQGQGKFKVSQIIFDLWDPRKNTCVKTDTSRWSSPPMDLPFLWQKEGPLCSLPQVSVLRHKGTL